MDLVLLGGCPGGARCQRKHFCTHGISNIPGGMQLYPTGPKYLKTSAPQEFRISKCKCFRALMRFPFLLLSSDFWEYVLIVDIVHWKTIDVELVWQGNKNRHESSTHTWHS